MTIFALPKQVAVTSVGLPYSLSKLYFYKAGTTTDQPVYTTAALNVAHAQPVVADAFGVFPTIYLDYNAPVDYRVQLKTVLGALIYDQDNYPKSGASGVTIFSTQFSYAQTTAEAAALVTPINYPKWPSPWKDISRFVTDNTGVTDETAHLVAAFAAEKNIVVPEGTYKYSSNFAPSTYCNVEGVPQRSIFKPTSAVTVAATFTASTRWSGITFDGSSTTNAVGASIAASLADFATFEFCEFKSFTGATSLGVKITDAVNTHFYRCLFTGNGTNVRIKGLTNSTPTTISFENCRNASSTVGPGYYIETGNVIRIIGGVAEVNTQEGVLVLPATNGTVKDLLIQGLWLEQNYANNSAKYHIRIGDGTAIGTAKISATLRDVFFNVSAGITCKSILIDGSAVQDVMLDNPRFPVSTGAGEINIDHVATCRIANFPYDKTYATLVTDTTKTTIAPDGVNTGTAARSSYTEVLGGGSITSTYRCTMIGRRCKFTASIVCAGGATIASVADTSFLTLTGAPVVTQNNVCNTLRMDNVSSLGQGQILLNAGATAILTPPWGAVANATYMIQGEYEF